MPHNDYWRSYSHRHSHMKRGRTGWTTYPNMHPALRAWRKEQRAKAKRQHHYELARERREAAEKAAQEAAAEQQQQVELAHSPT